MGWGGWHQDSVLSPQLPLAGRLVDMALVGSRNLCLPLSPAWVSISGMRAGYISMLLIPQLFLCFMFQLNVQVRQYFLNSINSKNIRLSTVTLLYYGTYVVFVY